MAAARAPTVGDVDTIIDAQISTGTNNEQTRMAKMIHRSWAIEPGRRSGQAAGLNIALL
jgi:hypothetical protein